MPENSTHIVHLPPEERTIPIGSGAGRTVHQFDSRSLDAINSALASGRPLLVRGEPGVGKTQLAEAAAEVTKRAFVRFTVDARSEARDLLWRFDAVMRLAEAQVLGATISAENFAAGTAANPGSDVPTSARDKVEALLREKLDVQRFIRPGPLWWAFNAESAKNYCLPEEDMLNEGQNQKRAAAGWVILIDEIDKAESDLPNGLLEALGSSRFRPMGRSEPVSIAEGANRPLIVITTNEDRVLPDAFIRRCMTLHIELPSTREALIRHLVARGRVHYGKLTDDKVLTKAAEMLAADRETARSDQLTPLPGQAEYLDLVAAVVGWKHEPNEQLEIIDTIRTFAYRKHRSMLTDATFEATLSVTLSWR